MEAQNPDWITVERTKAPPVPDRAPEETFWTAGGKEIRAWESTKEAEEDATPKEPNEKVDDPKKDERLVYVHREARPGADPCEERRAVYRNP